MAQFVLPSLLDRLVDVATASKLAQGVDWKVDLATYRQLVKRDLEDLLNATPPPRDRGRPRRRFPVEAEDDARVPGDFPLAEQSALYFGVPDLTGRTLSDELLVKMERMLQDAIERFEPRLDNVQVRVVTADQLANEADKRAFVEKTQLGVIAFQIEGDLYAEPVPEHLFLKTEFDSRTGRWAV